VLTVLSRYLVRQFLGIFLAAVATFIILYVVIDLFDRLDVLIRYRASVGAAARYFLFKIPLMVTQITPPAVITAMLLSLGLLARHNEIVALRAGGVGLGRTAFPLLAAALVISAAVLLWNETVVPYSSRKFEYVNNVEIRKRTLRGILSERLIWYHGANGFYHIEYVDKEHRTIHGLLVYRLDEHFNLQSVIEIPVAEWRDGHWVISGGVEHRLGDQSFSARPIGAAEVVLAETFDDFLEVQREPDEMSFGLLRDWITELKRKGIDPSQYMVDLHLKLAVPFASAALALVAIPIAGRLRRHPSIAATVGIGMAVGFAYWVVLGFSQSLGRSGALPPLVAAWAANGFFALIGVALFLSSE